MPPNDIERLFAQGQAVPGLRAPRPNEPGGGPRLAVPDEGPAKRGGADQGSANSPPSPEARSDADWEASDIGVEGGDVAADTDVDGASPTRDDAGITHNGDADDSADESEGTTRSNARSWPIVRTVPFEGPVLHASPLLTYAHDPVHAHSERIRLLRTELLLHPSDSGAHAVAVVSPGAGEGRSILAAELALSFSQFNRPTLLLDVDFRAPRQHMLFGAPAKTGLSQAIQKMSLPTMFRVEGFPNLAVVTAGNPPANPLELLMDWRFEKLLQTWREQFDFIVVDTPPAIRYADAIAISALVGQVLLVFRASHTRQQDAREMRRRLSGTGADIVGAALNHY